jgi:FkbM family methyltransferase
MIPSALSRFTRKIRLVTASDLTGASKLRYLCDVAVASAHLARQKSSLEYRLDGGISVILRGNSTDEKVFEEVFIQQTYAPFAKVARRFAPMVLIDLGANIGLSVIALDRELRPVRIVAVEPDGANFSALRENLRRAGLLGRCTAVRAFAGAERGYAELVDSGNGAWGMRMGAPTGSGIPVLPLEDVILMAAEHGTGLMAAERGTDVIATGEGERAGRQIKVVLKCDIEGAELHLFEQLRRWEDRVDYIILELHTEFLSVAKFQECLEASRYHWRMDGEIPADAVLAIVGLERVEAKAALPRRSAAGK